jgi:PncC family amidohydrolase
MVLYRCSDTQGESVKAEIFSTGTELLLGELTDTNSAWLAARLLALGIELLGVSVIGLEHGLTLATMENGTDGYLANCITEVPDSAAYFKGGVVAYSQEVHLANGVPLEVMQQHGTVSQASAIAMAQAVRTQLGADFGIGVTGIPEPLAVEGKPVSLAYVSIASASTVQEHEMRVPPRRITPKRF